MQEELLACRTDVRHAFCMVRALNLDFRMIAVALGLAACGDGDRPASADAAADASSSRYDAAWADDYDAASCDPLAFEGEVDASAANIAAALDPHCFHSGAARRELVIEALCNHERECKVTHTEDCRVEYETCWQEVMSRENGLPVPCMDALCDAMGCLAQASCGDARACDSAKARADAVCDPNTPDGPMCPPLPDDRQPTKGPLPEDAANDAGMLADETRIPDFIPALDRRSGEIAGYVRLCAIRAGGAVPVYADDLTTLVGHMIPNRGFVPGDVPRHPSPRSCWPSYRD
jgi:hypothetical protein